MPNTVAVAGLTAAFLMLAPSAALAAPPSDAPDGPRITRQLTVAPVKAQPGGRVKLDFACRTREPGEKVTVRSPALVFGKGDRTTGTIKAVAPGRYAVTLHCGPETSTASLEVLVAAKQVVKVPSGAPQTGGPDGPDGAGPLAAAAAMGALAVGGAGLVLARRVRRR